MTTNIINNSFLKKLVVLIFLLISKNVLAQINPSLFLLNETLKEAEYNTFLVLEKPEFVSPEEKILFFFSKTFFFDLHNFYGSIKEVENIHTVYNPDKSIISNDTSKFTARNHHIKNARISKKSIIDHIGIDSISIKGKTSELFHFDEESDYVYQVYELKNEEIINTVDNTSVQLYNTKYTYNKNKKLIKTVTKNDYGIHEIETATYNKNNTISSKKKFDTSNGINITTTNYTYKNNLLTEVKKHSVRYFVPLELEKNPIEKIDYSNYLDGDTFTNLNTIHFTYTVENKLIKVVETSKGFSENDGVNYENTYVFKLDYKSNKLLINVNLPERRTYEYIFDEFSNPEEINLYTVETDKTWLHKKTTFKILYNE